MPAPATIHHLTIVDWNVHVGSGQVGELLDRLPLDAAQGRPFDTAQGRPFDAAQGRPFDTAQGRPLDAAQGRPFDAAQGRQPEGIVLLLQEAYRSGEEVPDAPPGLDVPAKIHRHPRTLDIVSIARARGLNLAYVPSMRNGSGTGVGEREDRGSAILSSEPLSDVTAIELPIGHERRVAVLATVTPRGGTPVRVVAAHFDVLRGARQQGEHLAAYLMSHPSPLPIVLGIDANAIAGAHSGAVHAIEKVAPRLRLCGTGRTNAWLARIDFLFSNLPSSSIDRCETLHDRYGSDHSPQVLIVNAPT
ncbi:MAG TPA: endonuclease/exonuclease/phosphatase family protein [Vicinamibacterales bacterium]|nr:endonuclease/exonuclease/phosphatase family protein [Vicinamibacterales bacterium]